MRKRIIASLLIVMMIFSLSSCSSKADEKIAEKIDTADKDLNEKEEENENKEETSLPEEEKEQSTEQPKKQDVDIQEWTQAYIDLLDEMYGDENKFCFAYINEDNVPEIIWLCEDVEEFGFNSYNLFSYHDGEVYREHPYACGNISYIERQNKINVSESVEDYTFDHIFNMKFDCLVDSDDFDATLSETIATGYNYYSDECKWENKTMSMEQYEKELNAVFDTTIAKYPEISYDVDGMISILEKMQNSQKNNLPEWKQSYLNYIIMGNLYNSEGCEYSLINIDGDDIPELFCSSDITAEGMHLLTYYDGNVYDIYLQSGGFYYMEGENKCYLSAGRMDVYSDSIFHLEKGQCVGDVDGYFGLEDNTVIVDENGDPIPYSYEWDGKEVSEKTYNSLRDKAFNTSNAKIVEGQHDKEGILSVLSSAY